MVNRIFVEKKNDYNTEANKMLKDLKESLGMKWVEKIRIINRYDIEGVSREEYKECLKTIFSEATTDSLYEENIPLYQNEYVFAVEYLPGQYDQRADSAEECVQILNQKDRPEIAVAKVYIIQGQASEVEIEKIKRYCINPVDSREASLEKPCTLKKDEVIPSKIKVLEDFINLTEVELIQFQKENGLAMTIEDLHFCVKYFKEIEKRNPTETEIKVIDTYWSDHCRHTTFQTIIENVEIEKGSYSTCIEKAYDEYKEARNFVYENCAKDLCFMDMATIAMKELRKKGQLEDLDISEEINACSIEVEVDVDGKVEKWLVMFKNETHNHPTEIEPFGGAATCLGGAIRDPLSGRTYVYQAMRVTGSGDPRNKIESTLLGKLPQRRITKEAARGYSSYGNQIGLATGQVTEIYDEGFIAKRMEIGAVIAAAPKVNVKRQCPSEGDVVLLVGGRTGRDGCGGATGSSKEHTEVSIEQSSAEVQKGNAPTERKLQRLFRNPLVSEKIKRCNDFGAGGVAVAVGELTEGLEINLDAVRKKYEGLDGTELAISESQERMAVVLEEKDVEEFIARAREENLEATRIAIVTKKSRLVMLWKGEKIVDLSREFLNTNGVKQRMNIKVSAVKEEDNYFIKSPLCYKEEENIKEQWLHVLRDLNVCSQKGLGEQFDSTIGAATVLMPFGGLYQETPTETMVAKIPLLKGETKTATAMSYGYNAKLSKWSPFHGATYAIVEAVVKIVACGGEYTKIRMSLQEYFERLGKEESRWGKPFSALLGAFYAQRQLGIAAIGGKDSMSGTFKELDVPPTVVAFAVGIVNGEVVISPEFKKVNSKVILLSLPRDERELPNFEILKKNCTAVYQGIREGKILSAHSVKSGGVVEAISKMAFGNKIGMKFKEGIENEMLFSPNYGSFLLEIPEEVGEMEIFEGLHFVVLGRTQKEEEIQVGKEKIDLLEALQAFKAPLETVFPTRIKGDIGVDLSTERKERKISTFAFKIAKPKVFIPVFPGTNCEYDSVKVFEKAGAQVETLVFRNLSSMDIEESIVEMQKRIRAAQIIMIPGGFSAGDEPDGSGKFIATVFRNPRIKDAVMELLNKRDGLILGICNGFQALIKLGLLPYGEIRDLSEEAPTLTHNAIGRHVSCMVNTKVVSKLSPWLQKNEEGEIHAIPVSHGEGRFVASDKMLKELFSNGQVATQYVDFNGKATMEIPFNPNGSFGAIEGITSPDGRILGKMAHSERVGKFVGKNIWGEKDQKIFSSGVEYFTK